MPKTAEEYEAEIAKLQGINDGLKEQNKNLSEAHATTVNELAGFKKTVEDIAKKERESLEAEAHSYNKEYQCEGKSNDVLKAYIEGRKEQQSIEKTSNAPGIPHSVGGNTIGNDLSKKKTAAWMAGK